jgi:hypothetical protein
MAMGEAHQVTYLFFFWRTHGRGVQIEAVRNAASV